MKFNFKKIASVIASTVMLSSTVALAAAATYPAPFITDSKADVAVVYGATGADTDRVAAVDITTSLNSKLVTGATATEVTGGDKVKLERGTNKFNYQDTLSTHYTSLDDGELSTILVDGVFMNDDNSEYKFTQKIELAPRALTFFRNSNYNDNAPSMGFSLSRNNHLFQYVVDFSTNAEGGTAVSSDEYPKLDNQDITFLGKKWYISDAEWTTNGAQWTLLDSSTSATIAEGETETLSLGSKSYEVSVSYLSTTEVKLDINGELTNSLAEGQTYKLSDGTYVGIKDITQRDVAGVIGKVEISLGSGKLVLEHAQEITLNDDAISTFEDDNGYTYSVRAYFYNSTATNVDKFYLNWTMNSNAWIGAGDEIVMPGLEAIKISMGAWHGADDTSEKTTLADGGDYVQLTIPITEGTLKLPILYTNATHTGFTMNGLVADRGGLGEDSTHKLVTNNSTNPSFLLNESEDSMFVVDWINGDEAESYAFELVSIASNTNKTIIKNLVTNTQSEFDGTIGDTVNIGQVTFTLANASDTDGYVVIKATGTTVYGSLITSKEGLTFRLPWINDTSIAGDIWNVNLDGLWLSNGTYTVYTMNVSEEDVNGNIHINSADDKAFTITLDGSDVDGTQATGTSLTEWDESRGADWEIAYVDSNVTTKVRLYNPSGSNVLKKVEVYYPTEESYADVYITEIGAVVSASGATILPILDSAAATTTAKNLIVVGGSCINTVAADLLGGALCGADFTTKTTVGADQFLIETFTRTGGVATLVAGYNAGDTTNAAKYFTTQTVDTTAGKKYIGTTATSATLQVT